MDKPPMATLCYQQTALLLAVFVLNFSSVSWGQEEAEPETVDSATSIWFQQMEVSGTYHFSYQLRNTSSVEDNDFFQYLSLDVNDVIKDLVDVRFSMLWHEDLDGSTNRRRSDTFDPFLDIDQANDNDVRIFTGYARLKNLILDNSELRLGRQYFEEIDHIHFDGASYRFEPLDNLEVDLFGGRPVAFYSSTDGDSVYGTNLSYRFNPEWKAAFRYYRYEADQGADDLAEVELWHLFSSSIQGHAAFSMLNNDPYILQTDLLTRVESLDLDTTFQVVHLFNALGNQTLNFNPVFPLLNSYEPFTRGSVNAIKGLSDYFSLTAGFDIFESEQTSSNVVNFTNRDYQRYSGGIEIYPIDKLTISAAAEFWDVDPNDEFTGISGEVEYKPTPKWTLEAGMHYGEYVQEFRDEFLFQFGDDSVFRVSPEVFTYFGRVRWRPVENVYSSLWVELEDNDVDPDDTYSLRLEAGVHF